MPEYTADEIEAAIATALKDRDMKGVVDLLGLLTSVDAERAQDVLTVIEAGMSVALSRASDIDGSQADGA